MRAPASSDDHAAAAARLEQARASSDPAAVAAFRDRVAQAKRAGADRVAKREADRQSRTAYYEQLAARAAASGEGVCSESSAGAPSSDARADLRPPAIDTAPSSAPPADPRRPLSRKAWHKRELARIRLEESSERKQRAKADKFDKLVRTERAPGEAANSNSGEAPDPQLWSAGRTRRAVEARAKVRTLIDGRASAARARWRELAANAATAHFAIGIKRMCDARGWTLGDMAARRHLVMLEYFRELASPMCWNARYARRPRRGMGVFGDVLRHAGRKYSPCVRANARPFLATVIAWPGDTPEDSRPVNDKTVSRVTAALMEFGLLDVVQVPAHAAEAYEIGDSGHAINRYWLADKGSPKPALMSCWNPAGDLLWSDVLGTPWSGATPRHAADTPPPDPA